MNQTVVSYNQYLISQVETAPPERLMLMLFDGMIRFTHQAMACLDQGDVIGMNKQVKNTQNILSELMVTMNMETGGPIARNLFDLYEFYHNRLMVAVFKKDREILLEVHQAIREWRMTWGEAVKRAAGEKQLQRVV